MGLLVSPEILIDELKLPSKSEITLSPILEKGIISNLYIFKSRFNGKKPSSIPKFPLIVKVLIDLFSN